MEIIEKKKRGRPSKKILNISGDLLLETAQTNEVETDVQDKESQNESNTETQKIDTTPQNTPQTTSETTSETTLETTSETTLETEQSNADKETTLEDFILAEQTFKYNNITWTPHKYNIGDKVYVPVDEVVNISEMYAPIRAVLRKVPKKLTVGSVVYTNRVSYTFRETSKIIASENYVCATEEACLELCKEL